jgi:magnesium transporter
MNTLPAMTISQMLNEKNSSALNKVLNSLSGFELADMVERESTENQLLIFSVLSPELAADAFDYLSPRIQKNILASLPSLQTTNMLRAMPPDDRTALLQELPRTVVDEYLKLLPTHERFIAISLLGYPEDSVGRLMTTDYISVKMDWTVEDVLDHIRAYGHDSETINELYVVDDNNVLLDDIKLKEFLFVPKEHKVRQIGDNKFVAISALSNAEEAITAFREHGRVALPVIDNNGVMKGIVTVDDILKLASAEETEDIQKIGGTEALDEAYMETPFFELIKKRVRWLVVLFLGEMFTATALGYFEDEISKAVVLALFLPLIISSGGNAGSQSSTLIIRAMALGEVKLKDWWRIMKKEILSGLVLGVVLGVVGFTRVTLWSSVTSMYGPHWFLIAITIFLALIGVVLWGSLSGAMLPLILRRMRVDPATSSAPLVATLVDVTGIIIYFCIAMWILKGSLL